MNKPHQACVAAVLVAACASTPPPAAVTQQRPLTALMQASALPGSDTVLVLATMQQLLATHREWEGYEYFGRLAREQPQRRALFRSLQATMQARVSGEVPLLRRVAWVEEAIGKLDEGAAAEPVLGRLARGLVFADLPPRFGKARQAIDDLEACLGHGRDLPLGPHRGIYRGLAAAYRTAGDPTRSRQMLARGGLRSLDDPDEPRVLGDLSVDGTRGFRFGTRRLVREAEGVYVAEGYDFSNLAFIVAPTFVVAIDAGTTEETAREAVAALRKVTRAPIRYVLLTHGHWDHVGGLAAVREPGTIVIARAGFPEELQRSRQYRPPFQYFFGTGTMKLDVRPDRLITAPETITEGGLDLALLPGQSGETADALFVHDRKHDLLIVGDAFMPYVGAPFVAEGSPEGYLGAIAMTIALHPRRLIHGHVPLTAVFTMAAMPGLREAMSALYEHGLAAAHTARPLAEVLHDDFLPQSLRPPRPPRSPICWSATPSCSASTASTAGTGKRTARGSSSSPAPSGRPPSMAWAAAATGRSPGWPPTSSGAGMPAWPCRSPSWGWSVTPRAPRCNRRAPGRCGPCARSTRSSTPSASSSTRSGPGAASTR
jgi:glyoxylase-like metal-dependent hydrolase (beta-lactamase superfamily II)